MYTLDVQAVLAAFHADGVVTRAAQAERIGITREQWSRIVCGRVRTPHGDTVDKVVKACGLPYASVVRAGDAR
ncbi:helix-turn-helix domain-containing protein [Stackebrandtia soli]|uniref:helix-turn-helix domain-containing protein n=1 Tax=Stackebrandtia soli TaxID=1892856 RepID=UPI0039E8AA8B